MASCEINKFYGVVHDIAGVDKTSAIRMKDDLLFLPVGGKNHENEKLNTPDKTFKWGEYIRRKVNEHFANKNSMYGTLVKLTKDAKGTYVHLDYTKQLSDAIDYKNGIISEEQYIYELEKQQEEFNKRAEEANEKLSDEGDVFYQVEDTEPSVNYTLKAVNILTSDKAKQIFEKGLKNKWDLNKILTELAIPKEQKELILGLDKTNREDIITDLLANYSYTVEINTAKDEKVQEFRERNKDFTYNNVTYLEGDGEYGKRVNGKFEEISFQEYKKAKQNYEKSLEGKPTQYYSNLTVPGGTNYTENEIATPAITPSIKGHAQFSTDNGIGWFRSDDKVSEKKKEYSDKLKDAYYSEEMSNEGLEELEKQAEESTKTRRILEVQSDLFQKGRDNKIITSRLDNALRDKSDDLEVNDESGTYKTIPFTETKEELLKKNQFLQLLNKDNNWVTFFVKSIIQDSAKKGYEKVLFPTGNTASKVEGHTTLEEFKKQKEDRIKELENNPSWITNGEYVIENSYFKYNGEIFDQGSKLIVKDGFYNIVDYDKSKILNREDALKFLKKANIEPTFVSDKKEINQLKQELERIEKEGFGALKPIYNFYENTVTNILNKQGLNPTLVTDEYGNTWNEVTIDAQKDIKSILLQLPAKETIKEKSPVTPKEDNKKVIAELDKALIEFCNNNGIKVEFLDSLKEKFGGDYNAVFSSLKKTISVAQGKAKEDTLSEEVAHAVFEGLGENNPFVKRAYELIEQLPFEEELDPRYKELYKNNRKMLIKEYAGQKMASLMVNQYKGDNNLKRVLRRVLDIFLSLFKSAEQRQIDHIKDQLEKLMLPVVQNVIQGNKMNLIFPDGPTKLYQVAEPDVEKYQKQLNVFYKSRNTLKKALKSAENRKDEKAASAYRERLLKLQAELDKYNKTKNVQILTQLGEEYLKIAEQFIEKLEMNKVNVESPDFGKKLSDTNRVIEAFSKFPGLADTAISLQERWVDATRNVGLNLVNMHRTESEEIKWTDILKQKVDINRFTMGVGTLVDLADYLARTIGSIIKHAQNKISVKQKKLADEISTQVEKLTEWGKSHGMTQKEVYDLFIEEGKTTTHFVGKWNPDFYSDLTEAKKNKDFAWIKANTFVETVDNKKVYIPINKTKYASKKYEFIHKKGNEALLEFFNFYKEKIDEAFEKLPIDSRNNFIPNVYTESLMDTIKAENTFKGKLTASLSNVTGISAKVEKDSSFIENEDYSKDMLPLKYISAVASKNKSRNLGEVLYKFGAFAISHEEMSDVLPKVTLLQKHIESKGDYVKSSNRKSPIAGLDTNLSKMVSKVIDMQVKGNKTVDEMRLSWGDVYDENGNKIGKKVFHFSDVLDFGLKFNSILRIGLNPLNAVTNWLVGDIGNLIEGFGGRYFTVSTLQSATNIYMKDFYNENSKLHKLILKLNPLQELEDYQHAENLKFKKNIDKDKIKNFMYSPQRITENFLQTRTMIAIMMHQKLPNSNVTVWEAFDEDGNLKKEYKHLIGDSSNIETYMLRLTDKIQRVNQLIHGRYSERDAAIIQQNVLWRCALQFKKWIPAAIEQRFGKQQYDVRLGDTIEGRYVTFYRLVLSKSLKGEFANAFTNLLAPIFSYKEKLAKGEMTESEVYNMRKNLMEITLILATYLSYIAMGWDDDDEKKKNPYYKFAMSTLDRVSGDMLYFINPAEANRIVKSPVSMTRTVDDLINVVISIPSIFDNEKAKKDKRKKSFISKVAKVTPGAKPVSQIVEFFDKKKYREY